MDWKSRGILVAYFKKGGDFIKKSTYEIVASCKGKSNLPYISQTRKKYFNLALNWCLENSWNSCKVGRICFSFDFEKLEVSIGTNGLGYDSYKLVKVSY